MDKISRKDAISLGLRKYYTGEPCRNGHIAERYVQSGTCQECINGSRSSAIITARSTIAGEILPPEDVMKIHLARVQNEQLRLALRTQRLALDAQRAQLALENRAERKVRQHREIVRKSHLVDVIVRVDPLDYEAAVMIVWGFALMRDQSLRRDDIATGRTLLDDRFVMRCFGEDKKEILRLVAQMGIARHGVPVAEAKELREKLQLQEHLKRTAQAENNGQPEYDPR